MGGCSRRRADARLRWPRAERCATVRAERCATVRALMTARGAWHAFAFPSPARNMRVVCPQVVAVWPRVPSLRRA
eukprot:842300-Prymnesium_polylepis.1